MAYNGKVALVTGGGSGMGRVAARKFAAAGAKVALFDVNEAGMTETADGNDNIKGWVVDITSFDAVSAAVAEVEAEFGPLDRVYNCAAIMPFGKLLEQDAGVIHKLMEINYGGLVNISKATVPQMVERGSGEFISFASMAGIIPGLMMGAYNATKAAVAMYTEVLYHENRDSGVKFACVCPPAVATPLIQQGKDTAWPKLMSSKEDDYMTPEGVVDAVEVEMEKGKFWVFPHRDAKIGYIMRRLLPNLVWKSIHDLEGW